MSDKICCKIKAPFRVKGQLFDKVGQYYYATASVYQKLSKAGCLVKAQDPKTLEAEEPEIAPQTEKKSYSRYVRKK